MNIYIYIYKHHDSYVCLCMYVCMYACMHACMHACMYVCMHVCVYIYIYIYVCRYVYVYIYIYIILVKSFQCSSVVTSGASREVSIIIWCFLVQQQLNINHAVCMCDMIQ